MANASDIATRLSSRAFWKNLAPECGVEDTFRATGGYAFEQDELQDIVDRLRVEGYVHLDSIMPDLEINKRLTAIERVQSIHLPEVFAFVYDEFWLMFQWFTQLWSTVLGADYVIRPEFWIWNVKPDNSQAGWGPHRDSAQPTLFDDNTPQTLTCWIPLTDATPLNGCMYCIPMHLDNGLPGVEKVDLHNVRALPAKAGSLMFWNQWIVHWGGKASPLAEGPRISVALEFQRADFGGGRGKMQPPLHAPTLDERLRLISTQILQYAHMYQLSPGICALAQTFLRDASASATPAAIRNT